MSSNVELHNLPDQVLLSMLLGSEIASAYSGRTLAEVFGLHPTMTTVMESEATYLAKPIIGASKELMKRALCEQMKSRDVLNSPQAVQDYLRLTMGHLEHEVFTVIFLDSQNRLIESCEMFRGTLNQASVYPREVVKKAMQVNACAVILVHNHPSGLTTPSDADRSLTKTLKKSLALVDVRVLDHFIVGATSTPFSFAERGLL